MVFQSIEYLLFLVCVLAVYFWLPRRGQNALLIAASYTFYCWVHQWYLILIGLTTIFDWFCARGMEDSRSAGQRKAFFITSISVNLAILGVFKYFGFFTENLTAALASIGVMESPIFIRIALPAGISFFTFQSVSYAVDVYRGQTKACRSLLDYATFVSFFPQLVAGPIERAHHMLPQYALPRVVRLEGVRTGLVLLLWGLFQKVVIADSAALLADKVFSLGDASFPVLWGGVIAFGVQIYADFSGYTDMARGSARLLGIELCRNFDHPYLAQSPGEFWRRWHISLSTWFRDYVYIPLGGSRAGTPRMVRNLIITFFLSGLWHGAAWNYVIWGTYHGVLVALWPFLTARAPLLGNKGGAAGTVLRVTITFALMHIGWLMFREHSLAMLAHDLALNPFAASAAEWRIGAALGIEALLYGLPLFVILPLLHRLNALLDADDHRLTEWRWTLLQTGAVTACLLGIVSLRCAVGSDFIYFQF